MEEITKLKIQDTFKVTNRGVILTGIVESPKGPIEIKIGDEITFRYNARQITKKIIGLDLGNFPINFEGEINQGKNIGVLIECENEDEINGLTSWKAQNELGIINSKDQSQTGL